MICLLNSCGNNAHDKTPAIGSVNFHDFDWQGHRGARGLAPENTIPSFLKALELPVKTLELDVVISADSQIIVSHDPWMSPAICRFTNGKEIDTTAEFSYNIYKMTYKEISQFDCGGKENKRFPNQEKIAVSKPTLKMVVDAVKEYCEKKALQMPYFNIELKARPEWDGHFTPNPQRYTEFVIKEIKSLGLMEKTCIQSFDIRVLQEVHRLCPELITAFLVEDNFKGLPAHLEELGFTPSIFSPDYTILSKELVNQAHQLAMQVIPWTVNDIETMKELIDLGVDGIITDYPNLINELKQNAR